jgi:pyruvate formate lyase activating enzyme
MKKQLKARISRIQRFSVDDGPGIRSTVFFKGCNLSCKWCHNPECIELKSANSSSLTDVSELSPGQLMDRVLHDNIFYKTSGGGVTLSGGEPLLWPEFIFAFVKECKKHVVHTALDTAGCVPFKTLKEAAKLVDLFLYDIKAASGEVHKTATGVDNAVILHNLEQLSMQKIHIWVRVPVIPSINTDGEMEKIAAFLKPLDNIERIELLPYHRFGINKYKQLGIEYQLPDVCEPDEELLKRQYAFFKDMGQKVFVS